MVTLLRPYQGNAAGSTVLFDPSTEAALIAQGLAVAGVTISSGAQSNIMNHGMGSCPAGVSSVAINNGNINANSVMLAQVAQAAADGTALRVERVVCGAGVATVYFTANATAPTVFTWVLFNVPGSFTN